MILLFDPAPPHLQWCLARNGTATVHTVEPRGNWSAAIAESLGRHGELEAIGYVLHNGGEQITESVSLLVPDTLRHLENSVHLLPEHNNMTLKVSRHWMERRPDVPHFLFCDTAFFARLPSWVRDYAVPYGLTQKGIHRYGGFGLCHEWAWKQAQAYVGGATGRIISIGLGDHTNLAAIRGGIAVETTVGFTHLEGVLSSGGCGDIDPTIIFRLRALGLSYSAINRMLATESGFGALAGQPCHWSDVLDGSNDSLVHRLLLYQILKHIGALLAVLGGADVLVFVATWPATVMPFVRELCDALDFLGIRCQPVGAAAEFPQLISAKKSSAKCLVLGYDQWAVMRERIQTRIQASKEETT